MIEQQTVHRARPKCSTCGWGGTWRSSTNERLAEERAADDLAEHVAFWHPARHRIRCRDWGERITPL